ncbi:MAG TPA: hypothetical protein VEJ38_10025 [Candidatus Acidoferrales bacterium]|nr:hypothetical protein [Candidatus Acidoferrales bacterium]
MPFCVKCQRSFEGATCPVCGTPIGAAASPPTFASRLDLFTGPALGVGFFGVVFATSFYASPDNNSLLMWLFFVFFIVVSAKIALLRGSFSDSTQSALKVLAASIAIGFAGFALLLFANGALDRSPAQPLDLTVAQKYTTHSSKGGTKYHLAITPSWRPGRTGETLDVDRGVYQKALVGGTVSVDVHPGFFHYSWYSDVTPRSQ